MAHTTVRRPIQVRIDDQSLWGEVAVPDHAAGVVLFAHGSGSSRKSPRNQFVAEKLEQYGLGTLLIDLLTPEEEAVDVQTAEFRFDIPLLASRLEAVIDWVRLSPDTESLSIGVFGASTGAGAALIAAADRPREVAAVVSRGGRPDLAGDALQRVLAPTLLIVGGRDEPVIELNQEAMRRMRAEVRLQIVPGATHLFEEPGTLDAVARLASEWFARHLAKGA